MNNKQLRHSTFISITLSCVKNLPSHTEVFLKTGLAKFCQPKAKVGRQRGQYCRMPTLIQKAGHRFLVQTTKQPLSNFEHQKS